MLQTRWRGVLFTHESQFSLSGAGGRQCVWYRMGEWFADVNIVDWPQVARLCTQFLEAENIPVLAWPAYSLDMSPIEHVWDALDWCIRQHVPVPASIQQTLHSH